MHSSRQKFHIKTLTEQKENLSPVNLKKLFYNINKNEEQITEENSSSPKPFPGLIINKPQSLKLIGIPTNNSRGNSNIINKKVLGTPKNKRMKLENPLPLACENLPKLQFPKKLKAKTIDVITTPKFSIIGPNYSLGNHPLMNRNKNLSSVNLKNNNGLGRFPMHKDMKSINEQVTDFSNSKDINKFKSNNLNILNGLHQEFYKFNRINSSSNILGKDAGKKLTNLFSIGSPLTEMKKKKNISNNNPLKEEIDYNLNSSRTNRHKANKPINNSPINQVNINNIICLNDACVNKCQVSSMQRLKKSFSLNRNLLKKSKTVEPTEKEEEISPLLTIQNIDLFSSHSFPKSKLYLVPRSANIPVKAFSLNTTTGLIRDYNEDTLTATPILQNSAYFFGIFDGHGGKGCASFLQTSLPGYINSLNPKALSNSILNCEKTFLNNQNISNENEIDKSGSCANIVIVTKQNDLLFLNIGDSRALYLDHNFKVIYFTEDHKPNSPLERERIIQNGGSVYQNNPTGINMYISDIPFRVLPGRLSVSRTIGDIEAKDPIYGGNDKVIICEPDISKIDKWNGGFVLIGCDGIFDVLNNKEVAHCMKLAKEKSKEKYFCDIAVDLIIKAAMVKNSLDNLSCIILELENKCKQ